MKNYYMAFCLFAISFCMSCTKKDVPFEDPDVPKKVDDQFIKVVFGGKYMADYQYLPPSDHVKNYGIKLWYDQDLSGRAAEIFINNIGYDTIQKFPLEITQEISTIFINDLRTGLRRGYSTAFRFVGQLGGNNPDSLFIQINSRNNGYINGSFIGRNGDDKTDGTFRFKYK